MVSTGLLDRHSALLGAEGGFSLARKPLFGELVTSHPLLKGGKKKSTFLNTPLLVRSQNQLEAILPVPFSVQMHMIKKRVGVAR